MEFFDLMVIAAIAYFMIGIVVGLLVIPRGVLFLLHYKKNRERSLSVDTYVEHIEQWKKSYFKLRTELENLQYAEKIRKENDCRYIDKGK